MSSLKELFLNEWAALEEVWPTWGAAFVAQARSATELVVSLAALEPGLAVLDLASGTGEPAVSLARAVGPSGRVVATDLVPGAVAFVRRVAERDRLSALTAEVADAEALPFEDGSFDRITCRLGVMFFPDVGRALAEARRVLKSRGRAVFVAWGAADQPLFRCTLGELSEAYRPGAQPGRPGPFRFSAPGTLAGVLTSASFDAVSERIVTLPWPFPGPAELAWRAFRELSGPSFREALALLPEPRRAELEARIVANLRGYERAGITDPGVTLVAAVGSAP